MTTFGSKEPWMEHMNQFLTSNRQAFKDFIDNICSIPSDRNPLPLPPSYSTPLAIMQRLPQSCREGLPSLPYLIDQPRNIALLISLWLKSTAENPTAAIILMNSDSSSDDSSGSSNSITEKKNANNGKKKLNSKDTNSQANVVLRRFNQLCQNIQQRTDEYLDRAERADRPRSAYGSQWEELVEQLERSAPLDGVAPANSVSRESRVITGPVTLSSARYAQTDVRTQAQAQSQAQAQAQAQSPVGSTISAGHRSSSFYSNEDGALSDTPDDSSTVATMAAAAAAAAVTRTGFRTSVSGRSSRKGSSVRHGSVTSGTEEYTTALPPIEKCDWHTSVDGRAEKEKDGDREWEKGSSGGGGNGRFKGFTMPGFAKRKGLN